MTTNPKNQKESDRTALLRKLSLPKDTRAIILSYMHDPALIGWLSGACSAIGATLILDPDEEDIRWADIFVADRFDGILLEELLAARVVPVIPQDISDSKRFKEFNPMKFEGNAFIYESSNEFQIFEKIIRALENMRYPGDKRTLLKNIEETLK